MSKRAVIFLFLGAILAGFAEWELRERVLEPVRRLDRFWVDFCIGNAGEQIGQPAVTMVRITDDYEPVQVGEEDAVEPGDEAALTRLDYAAFLYAIGKLNPKAVSFLPAPVFTRESVLNATDIFPLKDAALQLPEMTLGTVVSGQGAPADSAEACAYPPLRVTGDISALPEVQRTVRPADPELLANGEPAFSRHLEFSSMQAGRVRIPLVARQGGHVVPGFVLASVARQAAIPVEDITVDFAAEPPRIRVGSLYDIPVRRDGTMELPSYGGLSHSMYEVRRDEEGNRQRVYHFASLKVEDVALAVERIDALAENLVEEFSGKFESISRNLVILGFDRSRDRTIETANEEMLSPLSATARAIATIQSRRHFERWPLWGRAAGYGIIALCAVALLSWRRRTTLLSIGLAVAFLITMVTIFRATLAWTPPAAYLGLFLLLTLFSTMARAGKKA